MTVFKCKMCGGTLEVKDGVSVAECEYCGTTQTLPTSNDEVLVNLFNRANNLRIKCEFDKAAEVYEKILDVDNTQAEAHWGIVLCKYGVEYVEDPHTNERIPTCHRTQMESILTDADYQSTIKYADTVAASVYETQAKEINELQKKILQIVKSEKPFDVFICYKETDDAGTKTRDSVIANEIYHELTNSGMKVFFAAITLEDKLGEEYEPYIYAALTSAKVMLVLGTKPEYFNAVWVKNEWSRYLHLMRTDREKKRTLIPCFRDMDAYDLPDDFSHLQALDMASIAFIPDLMRNIKKLTGKEQDKQTASQTDNGALPLLRRAYLFLEDGDFQRADELLEEVLNRDPENAQAYIGKLLVSHRLRTEAELATLPATFYDNPFYVKAHRFADDEYKKVIEGYNDEITLRLKNNRYDSAVSMMQQKSYIAARNVFLELADFRDSVNKAEECQHLETERIYESAKNEMSKQNYLMAKGIFDSLKGYKDSVSLSEECVRLNTEKTYKSAVSEMKSGRYEAAVKIFNTLNDYKDSKELSEECARLDAERIYQSGKSEMAQKNFQIAQSVFKTLGNYKDSKELAEKCVYLDNDKTYESAKKLMDAGDYEKAQHLFTIIKGHRDAEKMSESCRIQIRKSWCQDAVKRSNDWGKYGAYVEAIKVLDSIITQETADICPEVITLRNKWHKKLKRLYNYVMMDIWRSVIGGLFVSILTVPIGTAILGIINMTIGTNNNFWLIPNFTAWMCVVVIIIILTMLYARYDTGVHQKEFFASPLYECAKCGYIYSKSKGECPHCGHGFHIRDFNVKDFLK